MRRGTSTRGLTSRMRLVSISRSKSLAASRVTTERWHALAQQEDEMRATLSALATASIALAASAAVFANDFPTQARVEYVLRCMDSNGGQSYNTLYACVCAIDKIADSFSYDEFAEAETFALMRSTPGEQGGVFRDPDRAHELQKKYQDVVSQAEQSCFAAHKEVTPDDKKDVRATGEKN